MGLVAPASKVSRTRFPGTDPRTVAGLKLWYRTDQGYELATGVKTWFDITNQNFSCAQATGGNQPTVTAAAVNGKPGFVLDGTLQCWGPVVVGGMTACTIFLVCKINALFTSGTHDFLLAGGTGLTAGVQITSSNLSLVSGGGLNTGAAPPTGSWQYHTFVVNSTSSAIRRGGVQIVAGDCGAAAPDGLTVGALTGGTRSASVTVAEVLMYGSALSAGNITTIEAYLAGRYAL